jgi:hypothetical protein
MLKHGGEIPLVKFPAVEARVKSDGSHDDVAPLQLLPGVGGGVSEVIQTSNVPSPIIPATLKLTVVPAGYAQVAVAVPPAVAAASQMLKVPPPQAASEIVITACCSGVKPLGVTVIVLTGPAATNENQTSFTTNVLHPLVVFEEVAYTDEELMQIVPPVGMITGCAVTQSLFAGCALISTFVPTIIRTATINVTDM